MTLCTLAHCQQFALKDGETVVFYGDSITAQRLYTRYVEDLVLTRYPGLHIRFLNAGVPGDSVYGGYAGTMLERVQRDVASFHPGMITVMLGMNDGGWGQESPKIDDAFRRGYNELLAALHKGAPDATLTLIRPTPYDEITHGTEFPQYARVIDDLADDVSKIATEKLASGEYQIVLADFHQPLIDALTQASAQSPLLAPLIVPDRIHPDPIGHWIMTAALLRAWHVDPVVTSVALNAERLEVIERQRTTVSHLQKTVEGLQWAQLDEALPLPFDFNDAMIPLLLRISDVAKVDRQMLRVEDLSPGLYKLLIDDKVIRTASKQELEAGINLALEKTPMLDRARDIDYSEKQRMVLDQARFVLSADVKEDPTSRIAEDQLRRSQDELAADVRKKLSPVPHTFELRKQ